jgi:hypothetical protein
VNRNRNLICGLNNRVNGLKSENIIVSDLLISLANVINSFHWEKNWMGRAIKKFQDKINFFQRARDETVNYIDERIEEKIRTFEKTRTRVTRARARERESGLEMTKGED